MSKFDYFLVGFGEREINFLIGVFCLISDKLPLLGERALVPEDATILFVCLDSHEGRAFWLNHEIKNGRTFKIACASEPVSDAQWHLQMPFRVYGGSGIQHVLSNLFEESKRATVISSADTAITTHSLDKVTTSPAAQKVAAPCLDSLYTQLAEEKNMELHFPEEAVIVVLPANGQCYSNRSPRKWLSLLPDILAIHSAYPENYQVISETADSEYKKYPIESYRWCRALFFAKGRVLSEAEKLQLYQLKQWPNFTYLSHHAKHLALAGQLVRAPCSISELTKSLDVSPEFVIDFINACMAIGLVHDYISPRPTEVKSVNTKKRNPLSALLHRLGVMQ